MTYNYHDLTFASQPTAAFGVNDNGTVVGDYLGSNDGAAPGAGLVNVEGTLYGTTVFGGTGSCSDGCGTVFKITTAGVETVLYPFKGGNDGINPEAGLIDVGGALYGSTSSGGTGSCTDGCGTVFKLTTAGVETVLHSFTGGSDGENPVAGLIDVGGTLYSTTADGGANDFGIVFAITTAGAETVLYSFGGSNGGAYPNAGLINVKGTLYSTTSGGGANNMGTVFNVTP